MSEKWIDVSAHQGSIDWPKVAASGVKGAIVRAGYGDDPSQQDTGFAANIGGALAAGLKTAVYWFSYADSLADAQKEWAVCRQIISPYRGKIKFAAYDYEYDSYNYYRRIHGAEPADALINGMANAWLNSAKAEGWTGVLYTGEEYRRNVFSVMTLKMWDIWLADYSGTVDEAFAVRQTAGTGKVPGISAAVDLDVVYKDFDMPAYTCDTSGTVEIARGSAYQIAVTAASAPGVVAGTGDVVTILPRSSTGDRWFYYLVPIGRPGEQAGIYINSAPRQMIVKIK